MADTIITQADLTHYSTHFLGLLDSSIYSFSFAPAILFAVIYFGFMFWNGLIMITKHRGFWLFYMGTLILFCLSMLFLFLLST